MTITNDCVIKPACHYDSTLRLVVLCCCVAMVTSQILKPADKKKLTAGNRATTPPNGKSK